MQKKTQEELRAMGWDVLVVWECQLKDRKALKNRLDAFLSTDRRAIELQERNRA